MSANDEMFVIKRNNARVEMSFDKILNRIKKIGHEVNIKLNYSMIAIKVIEQLYNNIKTSQIDELMAEQCSSLSTNALEYGILASRLLVSNHQKNTPSLFSNAMDVLFNNNKGSISLPFWTFVNQYKNQLNNIIDHNRDYLIDFFGFKTLEKSYLFKKDNITIERPQYMWLRVSIAIHGIFDKSILTPDELTNCIAQIQETYDLMSQKYFTHATPTLFNAGTNKQQLSSCYLLAMEDDSIDGIFNTLKECAHISKHAGGIGIHMHNIRAKGSRINSTNGSTTGIIPILKIYNETAKCVNQSSKRNGSFAIYLEPWYADIEDFLELKKNHGDENTKARDLFYALWISDLFMERVKNNKPWSLMCPRDCPNLSDTYGDKFKILYEKYETDNNVKKTVNARDLWYKILDAQMETGTPYLLYKDAVNKKTNQKNVGTIKSSNLCCEIMEYSDENESAVCNLASIGLPKFVNETTKTFDYDKLHKVVKTITYNLNKVIDINFYPSTKSENSNLRHRPIGIGVQGLADTFFLMDVIFESPEASEINKNIFETIYHASLEQSNEIARDRHLIIKTNNNTLKLNKFDQQLIQNNNTHCTYNGAYSSFEGSPTSNGILQFDMWNVIPSNRYNWKTLKQNIVTYGIRNALLVAPMPTASTSQILGYNECFEPITSNIYSRRTLVGEYIMVNKYLLKELTSLGIWNETIKNNIIENKGSIQQLTMISDHIKNKYKTVWEISMKQIINMSADRGAYICQSQSMNLWVEDPTYNILTSMHFYSWSKGLKTGIYYLRRKAKHQAQQFTIAPQTTNANITNNDEVCELCSS